MEKGSFKNAFIVIATATVMVGVFPVVQDSIPGANDYVKSYSILPDGFLDFPVYSDTSAAPLRSLAILPDSILEDSSKLSELVKDPDEMDLEEAIVENVDGTYQGIEFLFPFFKELHERNGQIRIAYYGDSSIEGDLICMTFRDSLQRRYGGQGVGFVPIMSIHPGFRRSVHQAASNNWSRNIIGRKNYKGLSRGISGEYFTPLTARPLPDTLEGDSLPPPLDANYWASFKGSKWFSRTQNFENTRLFFGRPKVDSSRIQLGSISVKANQKRQNFTLKPNKLVNELMVVDSSTQRVRIDFQVPTNFPLYGVSMESDKGIIVDNFPLRGSDGGTLRSITPGILSEFQAMLDYDLIILQFGLNVMNPRLKDYSWYQNKMEKLIQHFQEAMPGVPILIVGISDKGTKINGQMQTDPSVPRITKAQRNAAQNKQVAFYSLYEAMGGSGVMVDWVEKQRPRLANRDYTHFNFKGARKVSYLLVNHLNENYMDYVVKHASEL